MITFLGITSRHFIAAIRVEVYLAERAQEAQNSSIGVDHFCVGSIIRSEAVVVGDKTG
jgi:hypothetical protein